MSSLAATTPDWCPQNLKEVAYTDVVIGAYKVSCPKLKYAISKWDADNCLLHPQFNHIAISVQYAKCSTIETDQWVYHIQ